MSSIVTDLDRLEALGYAEDTAKCALRQANGDYHLAARIAQQMTLGCGNHQSNAWTAEYEDDWVRNVPTKNLSDSASMRALGKTPIYIRIPSWSRRYSEYPNSETYRVFYELAISLKDGRKWKIEKSYREFYALYQSLPFGSCMQMKNSFPQGLSWSLFQLTNEQVEERRTLLEAWIVEVCLTESMITSATILELVYDFTEAVAHGGPVTLSSSAPSQPNIFAPVEESARRQKILQYEYKVYIPERTLGNLPISFASFQEMLPFKVKRPVASNEEVSGSSRHKGDDSLEQLEKDYSRDRVIVQGKRILGSVSKYEGIVSECKSVIAVLSESMTVNVAADKAVEMSVSEIEELVSLLLKKAGRTESAFHTHLAFQSIVNPLLDQQGEPVLIVPESELASPIELNFQCKKRPQTAASQFVEWCLVCDVKCGTTYKFVESTTVQPLLQVRGTMYFQLFYFPKKIGTQTKLTEWFIMEQDTSTTRRDWRPSD